MLFQNERGWLVSLTRKIYRTKKRYFIVEMSLFSLNQILVFLSFILPLKALVVVSTKSVPNMVLSISPAFDWFSFSSILLVLSMVGYATTIFIDRFLNDIYERHAFLIKERAKKISMLAQRDVFYKSIIEKVTRLYSSCFLFLFFSVFLLVFDDFSWLSLFYIFLIVSFLVVCNFKVAKSNYVAAAPFITTLSNVFFFVSMLALFAKYFFFTVEPLSAILSVLFLRQSFQRLSISVTDFTFVISNKSKINSQFFTYIPQSNGNAEENLDGYKSTLLPSLYEYYNSTDIELCWLDSCAIDVPLYLIKVDGNVTSFCRIYFIRTNHILERELILYQNNSTLAEVPNLTDRLVFEDFSVLIFEVRDFQKISNGRFEKQSEELKLSLCGGLAPQALLEMQARTTLLYYQSEKVCNIEKLKLAVSTGEDVKTYERISSTISGILVSVRQLPYFISNPELTPDNFYIVNGTQRLISWAGWQALPVGATLTYSEFDFDEISRQLNSIQLSNVCPYRFYLSSMLWQMQFLLSRNRLNVAMIIASRLSGFYLENIEELDAT